MYKISTYGRLSINENGLADESPRDRLIINILRLRIPPNKTFLVIMYTLFAWILNDLKGYFVILPIALGNHGRFIFALNTTLAVIFHCKYIPIERVCSD